jgi:hypothetical protein
MIHRDELPVLISRARLAFIPCSGGVFAAGCVSMSPVIAL